MTIKEAMVHFVVERFVEGPAQKKSLAEIRQDLQAGGEALTQILAGAADTPSNRKQLRHVIGIERWGQKRLRVALGEAFVPGEYDEFCPAEGRAWAELRADFAETRQATLGLTQALEKANLPEGFTVRHNSFGPLSVKGWLRYLNNHAGMEGKRIR